MSLPLHLSIVKDAIEQIMGLQDRSEAAMWYILDRIDVTMAA